MITPEFDAFDFNFLMKIDRVDFGHAVLQIRLIVQHVISAYVT
jgi:hypothetical protein